MTKKLNLAILLDNENIFLWQFRILEILINSEFVDLKLLIINEKQNSNIRDGKYSIFYLLHEKIDKLIFGRKLDFDKKVNVLKRLNKIDVIELLPKQLSENFSTTVQHKIHISETDLLLNFSNTSISADLLNEFRYGVLTYSISRQIRGDNAPSCYWEVVDKMAEIEVSIQLENTEHKDKVTIFRTGILPYPNSINVNRNNLFELASFLVPRVIHGIYTGGNIYLNESIKKNVQKNESVDYSVFYYPTSVQAFFNLVSLHVNFLKKKILYNKIGRWFLLVKIKDNSSFTSIDPASFKVMKAPRNKFWADPFIVSKDNLHYIFIEEYLYKTDKGHISVLQLNEKGDILKNEILIEKPYHLSYPHVFKFEESYYMVPETGSNNTIELYKCTNFPYKWEFVKNIMENISAKDSTFFFHNGKWWLFTSIIQKNSATITFNELYLYYSDDLYSSNWHSHPQNPIVSDQKLSRSAGNIFIDENKIYRPSQDCSGIYGRALNINLITKLSETEYEEVLISKTEPTWDHQIKGIHTYNFNEKITVMDAFIDKNRITG